LSAAILCLWPVRGLSQPGASKRENKKGRIIKTPRKFTDTPNGARESVTRRQSITMAAALVADPRKHLEGMVSEYTPDVQRRRKEKRATGASTERAHAAATDPGCERETNEDRYLITTAEFGAGYFVFDGMGGEPGGEAAAQISADAIQEFFEQNSASDLEAPLHDSIEFAQHRLLDSRHAPGKASMGTTVVGLCINGSRVEIAAVGDSRAYKVSGGSIQQLTSDHTIVQQLVDAGHLNPQDALVHPQSHVLTRCLGSEISFAIDTRSFWVWPEKLDQGGDSVVLCSDGLYSLVSDQEICEAVEQMGPQSAVAHLIALARDRGGYDNITVIVVPLAGKLSDTPQAPMAEAEPRSSLDSNGATRVGYVVGGHVPYDSNEQGKKTLSHNLSRHMRNLVLLACMSGFAAIVSFALLLVLRG
jgi:serine/threonine protein phosphatase PrpC